MIMIADKEKVRDLIPQKFPFVMVDNLLNYSEEFVLSNLTVTKDNIFYDNSNFNESGIIENMAQTVALHTGYQFFLKKMPAPTGYIGSIKNVVINRLPELKETLETSVKIIQEFMGVTLVEIEVKINNELIAHGQMKTVLAS